MRLVKNYSIILPVIAIGIVFFILRIPSLFEPHWYGDEGVYQVVGKGLLSGRLLYQDIWDNKPPLLYLIYALVNGNLFLVKLLSLLAGLFTIVAFYLLSRSLFKKSFTTYLTVGLIAFFLATPLLEGNVANAENFMLLPIVISAYFVLKFFKSKNTKALLIAGVILSIALAIKIVSIFDFMSFLFFLLVALHGLKLEEKLKAGVYFSLSFASTLIFFSLFFLIKGALLDFVDAVFLQNVSYVGENNSLVIPMGVLLVKIAILLGGLICILYFRKKLSWQSIFIYSWVLFSLFNVFFSERPYTHYVLLLLPSVVLLFGLFIENTKTRIVNGLIIGVIMVVVYGQFPLYKKTTQYYINFIEFTIGRKSVDEYRNFFDGNTSLIYDVAQFIRSKAGDSEVFLWSDAPQMYVLSDKLPIGKFVVSYHINFYKDAYAQTTNLIEVVKPMYIIQTTSLPLKPEMIASYNLKYIMRGVKIYERTI